MPEPFPSPRVLVTAGATREPIDDVRFIGNRSSGQLGVALADEAARLGLDTTLAAGKSVHIPDTHPATTLRFDSTEDLQSLLAATMRDVDILVMAAAVADHAPTRVAGKLEAVSDQPVTLQLHPTPDLLAGVSRAARPDQLLVGFALEPSERLEPSARRKLERKRVDVIIANPLETMDAGTISATLFASAPLEPLVEQPPADMPKAEFAAWLWPVLLRCHKAKATP
jgi:phosphopantothenoylcysteine decarboxylase/phosphopantothenate--cysteine ligase